MAALVCFMIKSFVFHIHISRHKLPLLRQRHCAIEPTVDCGSRKCMANQNNRCSVMDNVVYKVLNESILRVYENSPFYYGSSQDMFTSLTTTINYKNKLFFTIFLK